MAVRRNVRVHHGAYRGWFASGWYARNPRAWRAARWTAATVWTAATWSTIRSWWGWKSEPYYYDYGTTIVYEGDTVYYGGKPAATAAEYYEQAASISSKGDVQVDDEGEWRSLGVFALVKDDEEESNTIFQLAVNKAGIMRGNYHDALTQTTLPLQGSVEERTQRAAWTVGENKNVVYETGLANLTHEETQVLIHYGKEDTQQWMLVRLEAPEENSDKAPE